MLSTIETFNDDLWINGIQQVADIDPIIISISICLGYQGKFSLVRYLWNMNIYIIRANSLSNGR